MDPVTVMAAIAAVKASLKTAKDVQGIASSLDALFHHRSEAKKRAEAAKKKPSKLSQFIRKKTGEEDNDDPDSISSVMTETLEKKKLDRELLNLSIKINNTFGPGTWQKIIETRQQRIKKRKELEAVSRENKRRKAQASKEFWHKVLVESGKVVIVVIVLFCLAMFLKWAMERGAS
jgi:hypothetical protein